jgi:acyl-coenzyme A thioesterase PaaI-like protein
MDGASHRPPPPDPSAYGNCFGCAPGNMKGLRLTFRHDEAGRISTDVCLGRDFESFPGIIHGGIVATVLDEVLARASLHAHRLPSMTVGLRLRYVKVMRTGQPYVAVAEVQSRDGELVRLTGRLESATEGLIAAADATFMLLDPARMDAARQGLPEETLESFKRYMREVT